MQGGVQEARKIWDKAKKVPYLKFKMEALETLIKLKLNLVALLPRR